MKKLIAITLIAVMVLGLAACGTINKAEVSVLWSGDGIVKVPDSLINAMERAMYIENISYKHYGSNGDQAAQTKQAQDALNAGCAALVVELVDVSAAQTIVDAAKAKNVPVIFFNCAVEEAVASSYEKCIVIDTDADSLAKVYGDLIATSLYTEKKGKVTLNYDRNADGKISYAGFGEVAATVEVINAALTAKGLAALEAVSGDSVDAVIGSFTEESAAAELIITTDDTTAQSVLVALQGKGYNKDRLSTHCIPVFTVGNTADYKALVLADRPEGAHDADNVQEYFKSKQYLVDLRTVEEKDLDAMIYTTTDIISDGRLAGTAVEDYDSIAVAVAAVLRNLLKGNETFKDIAADQVVGTWAVKIPYTTVS